MLWNSKIKIVGKKIRRQQGKGVFLYSHTNCSHTLFLIRLMEHADECYVKMADNIGCDK